MYISGCLAVHSFYTLAIVFYLLYFILILVLVILVSLSLTLTLSKPCNQFQQLLEHTSLKLVVPHCVGCFLCWFVDVHKLHLTLQSLGMMNHVCVCVCVWGERRRWWAGRDVSSRVIAMTLSCTWLRCKSVKKLTQCNKTKNAKNEKWKIKNEKLVY